jgi:iron complex transport system substrate-binding protein
MRHIWFLSLFLLVISCTRQPQPETTVQRIVSLSPHITEIIYALGQQKKIVAVSDFCNYPPEAQSKERIGGLLNPNLEKILSLRANLFIGTPAHSDLAGKLTKQHLKAVLLPNDRLEDIFTSIDSIGSLLHCPKRAETLIRTIRDSLRFYQTAAQQLKHRNTRALFVIGREPGGLRKITIASGQTFLSQVWKELGGSNTFGKLPMKYVQINREALLENNPDVVIEFRYKESWNAQKQAKLIKEWQRLNRLQAVQNKHIFAVTKDYTLIPGPRIYKLAADYYHIMKNLQDRP